MNESTVQLEKSKPLPHGWRWVRLRDVCEKPQYGYTASAEPVKVGPKFLRITDIQNGEVHWESVPYCRCGTEAAACALKPGDILFARTGGTTGKSFLVKEVPAEAIFASYLIRVRTRNDLLPEYLYLFLQSDMYWKQVITSKRGGAQPNMNATLLSDVLFPLPPLLEQKRIVAKVQELLKDVEHARLACEARIEAARALPQAYLRQVFEGEEAKKWEKRRLGEVAKYINGRAFTPDEWGEMGTPIIRIQNLNDPSATFNYYNGEIEDCYKVRNGDLLISWSASLGAYIWRRGDAFLNQHIFRVEECSNLVLRDFLFFAVNYIMAEIRKNIHGATMQHITKPKFERIFIPLPPLTIQRSLVLELSEKTEEAEKLKEPIEKQLDGVKALPHAILRRAVRGEL